MEVGNQRNIANPRTTCLKKMVWLLACKSDWKQKKAYFKSYTEKSIYIKA